MGMRSHAWKTEGGESSSEKPLFKFQLNNIDSYQISPTSHDRNRCPLQQIPVEQQKYDRVPTIRVFGESDSGQKVCAHIHGVFPYLFVEYCGTLDQESVDSSIKNMYRSINDALNTSYSRSGKLKGNFIANIILCKAVPFYGFHVGWKYYLKIYLLGAATITRLADLLRQGTATGTKLLVYEAHLPYVLQFLTDFNLFGCGWVNCSSVLFRKPLPDPLESGTVSNFQWTNTTITPAMISNAEGAYRMSHCELEVDILAQDIMNQYDITERNIHHDFRERIQTGPSAFKFMHSMAELWKDERSRRKHTKAPPTKVPPMSADLRSTYVNQWNALDRLEPKLRKMIERDHAASDSALPSFEGFEHHDDRSKAIPTLFQLTGAARMPRSTGDYLSDSLFWDHVSAEELAKIDDASEHTESRDEASHIPAAQQQLKRKFIDSTSSDSPIEARMFSSSELSIASSPVGSSEKKARRTVSIREFGVIVKDTDTAQNLAQTQLSFKHTKSGNFDKLQQKTEADMWGSLNKTTALRTLSIPTISSTPETKLRVLEADIAKSFNIKGRLIMYPESPVSGRDILNSLERLNIPQVIYQEPFYSVDKDVPSKPREYAGKEFRIKGASASYLAPFTAGVIEDKGMQDHSNSTFRFWQYSAMPPSRKQVQEWIASCRGTKSIRPATPLMFSSQIQGPTQKTSPTGHRINKYRKQMTATVMSVFSMELHVNTRPNLLPDPTHDAVKCVVWYFQPSSNETLRFEKFSGVIVVASDEEEIAILKKLYGSDILTIVPDELELFASLSAAVHELDPDVFTGYELQGSSWGYMISRAQAEYDFDFADELSRVSLARTASNNFDRWGYMKTSTVKIVGRHVLNIWRILRNSVTLLQYSIQNCAFRILKRRIPYYTTSDLTKWYQSGNAGQRMRVIEYYQQHAQLNLDFLRDQEVIERTSEQARVLGVDFYSVISRGSQFKVESLMFRIAKAENYILLSPDKGQVGQQNALECLPLVMEPHSNFYTSPVVVLDFQSLYPSIMIAHNYCYSTCLGRIETWRGRNKLGVVDDLQIPTGLYNLLKDDLTISPNGLVFVKPNIRQSLLAKMLTEILETRVMVKNEMRDSNDTCLKKLLNNRQLALKFIANVTYGYTSASFSGRMPCVEIADAIVQSGREILERSIELINTTEKWGAKVVYGDTDSLFVHLPGKSKDQAFDVGKDISEKITQMNPRPIKLKMEKVYLPCVLQAKKRYVGFMYESKEQKEPVFDAKGTETVRRDGTPAEQQIEERALKILFRTADLSEVKSYFQDQCMKIMRGKVSIQDFCFAKEVRLGHYSEGGLLPPGAMITTKKMQEDRMAEVQYGERVPYVVIAGAAGTRLVDRCVAPETLLTNNHMFLDAEYYITKNLIPPLDRIFNLFGASSKAWYDEMPKVVQIPEHLRDAAAATTPTTAVTTKKSTLHSYMKSAACIVCRVKQNTSGDVCDSCMTSPEQSYFSLKQREREHERRLTNLLAICHSCTGVPMSETIECRSQDCPVYYSRVKEVATAGYARAMSERFEEVNLSW
ncbi:uncharacterized protein V1518DRAFT_417602 [Limtongia smithiae]|uniref:uncharacterized protein n=1 Tax=Limtongia smithiae TaxID=1125753 RepID=UPI0034CD615E